MSPFATAIHLETSRLPKRRCPRRRTRISRHRGVFRGRQVTHRVSRRKIHGVERFRVIREKEIRLNILVNGGRQRRFCRRKVRVLSKGCTTVALLHLGARCPEHSDPTLSASAKMRLLFEAEA